MRSLAKKIARGRRYGTLSLSLHRKLCRIGIAITPYYLVREQLSHSAIPELKDRTEDYQIEFLSPQDMKTIGESNLIRGEEQQFLEWLDKGWKCLGVKHLGKIVAYTWIDLEECHFSGYRFPLKKNEAYLFNMFTANSFRGKNIAAYLRYETYKVLNEMGREKFYSISEVFNKPSIKFKQKLDAKLVKKGVYITLFNKLHWNIIIKKYIL
jgi:hypothetical protein